MFLVRRFARCHPALLAFCLVALSVGLAHAAEWTVSSVRGTVLFLDADKWSEVSVGQSLPGSTTLRTLGSGRLTVAGEGIAFGLGGSGAVHLDPETRVPTISHLAGTLAFAVAGPYRLVISTPGGSVTAGAARGRVTVNEQGMVIVMETGRATAALRDGKSYELAAGDTAELAADGRAQVTNGRSAGPGTGKPADTPGQGNAGNGGGGNGNGNGNAGGNGNSDNAGSGNSNAGGNSGNPGNSGGNGASSKDSTTSGDKGSGASAEKSNKGKKGD